MGKYQGYEKYKDSGVKWLGEIPEHWEAKRVKYAFLLQRGYDLSRDDRIIDGAHFTPTYVDEGILF